MTGTSNTQNIERPGYVLLKFTNLPVLCLSTYGEGGWRREQEVTVASGYPGGYLAIEYGNHAEKLEFRERDGSVYVSVVFFYCQKSPEAGFMQQLGARCYLPHCIAAPGLC